MVGERSFAENGVIGHGWSLQHRECRQMSDYSEPCASLFPFYTEGGELVEHGQQERKRFVGWLGSNEMRQGDQLGRY